MADKSISELIAATQVTSTDLFVLEQSGTAKKLTGQVLENWLVSFADGHGGIQSIAKLSTSGLADTYRITLADTTTFDFVVTNGKGITSISKTSTSGLVDTYTISYNNGTTSKFTVTNGAKGDKGDNAYIWIKYASQKPTEASHSMGDIPDDWIGIYSGNASSAPTDWKQYKWFEIKGEKGDIGVPATLVSRSVTYQVGDSGSIIPSGSWVSSVPVVPQGKYLWTRTEVRFNTGDPIVYYSVARMGVDGTGSVSSINNVGPDETGNVALSAADVGALSYSGGDMTGEIRMNGQSISGLNPPTEKTQAANKGYTDASVRKAAPRNLLDNSDFRNPVNQRGNTSYSNTTQYTIDRWRTTPGILTVNDNSISITKGSSASFALFVQYVPDCVIGKSYTFAIKKTNGEIAVINFVYSTNMSVLNRPFGNTSHRANIRYNSDKSCLAVGIDVLDQTSCDLEYAALYEGEYTTETLPEYQPKGYGAELAECQRYFQRFDVSVVNKSLGLAIARSATAAAMVFNLMAAMRTHPAMTSTATFKLLGNVTKTALTPVVENAYPNLVRLNFTTSGLTTNAMYFVAADSVGYMDFSADL